MMELPEPSGRSFSSLIINIESGQLKIPQFQRDFVWNKEKSAQLIDSILKGYPIGTLIFWKTKERLRDVKNIGQINFPQPERGDYVEYVLDGQQRLTSIYASIKGEKIQRENGNIDDFSEIYIDLTANEDDEEIVTINYKDKDESSLIKLSELINGTITQLNQYPNEYHEKLSLYQQRINSYTYSIIQIRNSPLDIATEVFTRINTSGKPLSLFEIMVAKTYDPEKFDLAEKYRELIESLQPLDYETISDTTILQIISIILKKESSKKVILKLDKQKFIDIWEPTVDAIERAVEYLKGTFRIPVSNLLPYSPLIAPFAYFFYHHPDKPEGNQKRYLEDFFWRCVLSERYSSGQDSKLSQDIKRIDRILIDERPKYDFSVNTSAEYIKENGYFNSGRGYIKGILCLYAYHQPKSFNDGSIVNIGNYYLKQSNSKNYHHFFPKAYLTKQGIDNSEINHILNITLVDDFLNKRKIKDKSPSEYMNEFLDGIGYNNEEDKKSELSGWMKTHLIDLDNFGIWEDDYEKFIDLRAEKISEELEKRIIRGKLSEENQTRF